MRMILNGIDIFGMSIGVIIDVEKKCENCVFCKQKPEYMNYLPSDFICGLFHSKWHGYWPYNDCCCEYFTEPTGKTVEDVFRDNEQMKQRFDSLLSMMGGVWKFGNKDVIDGFMKQDAAVLSSYEIKE